MRSSHLHISRRHLIAIGIIPALGAAGAAGLLLQHPSSSEAKHADAHGHEEGHSEEHDDHGKAAHSDHVTLTNAQIRSANIGAEPATTALLATTLQLPGEIKLNEDRTAHVVPRVVGVVDSVSAELGQQVKQGQVLAVVYSASLAEQRSELQAAQQRLVLARQTHDREKQLWQDRISAEMDYLQARQALREAEIAVANVTQKLKALGASASTVRPEALGRFELRAPFDAVVLERHLVLGEAVKEDTDAFTLADLSTVWADVQVPPQHLNSVRVGQGVTVRSEAFPEPAQGTVRHVGALIGGDTRTALARVVMANPERAWRPGLLVEVIVGVGQAQAAVTVPNEALHNFENQTVVFARAPSGFTVVPVKTGRTDGQRTEILSGLNAGTSVATRNSFFVKAELGKASAAHDH